MRRPAERTTGMRLNPGDVNVRKMTLSDLDSIVEIDEKVFGKKRPEYYQRKVEYALDSGNIVTSLSCMSLFQIQRTTCFISFIGRQIC